MSLLKSELVRPSKMRFQSSKKRRTRPKRLKISTQLVEKNSSMMRRWFARFRRGNLGLEDEDRTGCHVVCHLKMTVNMIGRNYTTDAAGLSSTTLNMGASGIA